MKKFISGLIIGICLMFSIGSFANSELSTKINPFPVLVNGVRQAVDAYNINGSTYIKLSDVAKTTDGIINVKFDGENKTININTTDNKVIAKPIEEIPEPKEDKVMNDVAMENIQETLQTPSKGPYDPIIENGIEYYPLMLVGNDIYNLGYRMVYDKETETFYMTYNDDPLSNPSKTKTILKEIPFEIFGDRTYFEKDYYINIILPLIK